MEEEDYARGLGFESYALASRELDILEVGAMKVMPSHP